MTHKAPYAWPAPPARAPQHSGQPGKLPARYRARRALKLAAVASVWVTGLAVVVIAVAMVAMTTAPSSRSGQGPAAGNGTGAGLTARAAAGQAAIPPPPPAPGKRAIQPARPAVTSLSFSGRESANTTPFVIAGSGRWKVTWSYSCAGRAPGFTLRQASAPVSASGTPLSVTRSAASAHGVSWAQHDAGQQTLQIRTACAWTLAVTSYS